MNRVERFNEAYKHLFAKGYVTKRKDIADAMNAAPTNVSIALNGKESVLTDNFLLRFNSAFNNIFSLSWLLHGTGQMLAAPQEPQGNNIIQGGNISNIQQVNGHSTVVTRPVSMPKQPIQDAEAVEVCEECGKPVSVPLVPVSVAQSKDEDVWAYINAHKVPRTPVVHQFANYDITYQVHSDAMAPRLKSGDYIALKRIGDHPKIFNGEVYCIDTKDTGFIVREVTNIPDGYKLHARSERYEDDFVTYDQVLGVYEVIGAITMNI